MKWTVSHSFFSISYLLFLFFLVSYTNFDCSSLINQVLLIHVIYPIQINTLHMNTIDNRMNVSYSFRFIVFFSFCSLVFSFTSWIVHIIIHWFIHVCLWYAVHSFDSFISFNSFNKSYKWKHYSSIFSIHFCLPSRGQSRLPTTNDWYLSTPTVPFS